LRERFGITRVADTTYLDRTMLPTYAAVVPNSPDLLSVYSGKGTSPEAAMLSAVMEAVERQAGAAPRLPIHNQTLAAICDALQISEGALLPHVAGAQVQCVSGFDVHTGDPLSVPIAMVQCPWSGQRFMHGGVSTNGLASGNTLVEAVYHALCEVIERHVWSMFHTRSTLVPKFYGGPEAADVPLAPELNLPAENAVVDALVQRVRAAGLELRIFWLQEGEFPYVFVATVSDRFDGLPMTHVGMGCSLSPEHAVTRAVTEAIQSRVVDIQGAREDILRAHENHPFYTAHSRRRTAPPTRRWYFDLSADCVAFAELWDRSNEDLGQDVRTILNGVRSMNMGRMAVVDLTPDNCPISVVRVIAPGLETTAVDGMIGARAAALFNPFALC
ncbi:MAG: YcaO-like family protein, partial [Candidatus Eremiobacteraeota bacterium]|nr:YcaO-like family protein [Candidatus Eremiobacteraeota bacterium]